MRRLSQKIRSAAYKLNFKREAQLPLFCFKLARKQQRPCLAADVIVLAFFVVETRVVKIKGTTF